MLSGVNGRIDWHYYTAAGIHGYTVTPPPKQARVKEWSLVANVVLHDDFKMAQRPLTFVAKHAKGEWRFTVISFLHDKKNHRITAKMSPPENKVTPK